MEIFKPKKNHPTKGFFQNMNPMTLVINQEIELDQNFSP
jgi:hypothetical protein